LHSICEKGNLEVMKWLHSKFNLTEEDIKRTDLLEVARFYGHLEVVDWLLSSGSFLSEKTKNDFKSNRPGYIMILTKLWMV